MKITKEKLAEVDVLANAAASSWPEFKIQDGRRMGSITLCTDEAAFLNAATPAFVAELIENYRIVLDALEKSTAVVCPHEYPATGQIVRSAIEKVGGDAWWSAPILNLAASLADDALTAPIEELKDEIRAEGKDPAEVLQGMREIIVDAQKRLEQVSETYDLVDIIDDIKKLPLSPSFDAVDWHAFDGGWIARIVDDIPREDCCEDEEEWYLHLYRDGEKWVLDYDHDHRGGPQSGNGLQAKSDVEAKVEAVEIVQRHSEVWKELIEEELIAPMEKGPAA